MEAQEARCGPLGNSRAEPTSDAERKLRLARFSRFVRKRGHASCDPHRNPARLNAAYLRLARRALSYKVLARFLCCGDHHLLESLAVTFG